MGLRMRLVQASTALAACVAIVLGLGLGSPASSGAAEIAAKRVAIRFFHALDRGRWSQACSLLARQFYRANHVPDRRHCVVGLTMGMGGWAVRFRIDGVDASADRAVVHAVVDGAPGTVELVRESGRFRVAAMRG